MLINRLEYLRVTDDGLSIAYTYLCPDGFVRGYTVPMVDFFDRIHDSRESPMRYQVLAAVMQQVLGFNEP